jgi:hypothetical protein
MIRAGFFCQGLRGGRSEEGSVAGGVPGGGDEGAGLTQVRAPQTPPGKLDAQGGGVPPFALE